MSISIVIGALIAMSQPQILTIDGAVSDVLPLRQAHGTELWVSVTVDGERRLERVHSTETTATSPKTVRVPRTGTFVAACPLENAAHDTVLYIDEKGVISDAGARVVAARPLTSVADPLQLFVADLCSPLAPGELRLPVEDGILVRSKDKTTVTLPFDHRARAFSGKVHRGFRPARTYAAAVSLYAPRLFDVDVDGDGALDLVVAHEERVVAFARGEGGRLSKTKLVEVDLVRALGIRSVDDVDLRVLIGDVDGDRRADIVIGVTAGALPERSATWLLSSPKRDPSGLFATRAKLLDGEGLVAPLSIVARRGAPRVLFSDVDTSMMALGSVLLSGSIDVKTSLREANGARRSGPVLGAAVDVRRARMVGALPVADVDLDGDGITDLLDVGIPGRAFIYRGTADGYEGSPSRELTVPVFEHIVPLAHDRAIVLVGAPASSGKRTVTRIAIVRGDLDDRWNMRGTGDVDRRR